VQGSPGAAHRPFEMNTVACPTLTPDSGQDPG
jgi:hypothetical protein